MKQKRWKILLVVVLGMGALTWLLWPSDWLTSELLSQIKIGMSTHEVIHILGTPTSEKYSQSIGHWVGKIDGNGVEVPAHNETFEPTSFWSPRILIDKPSLMPIHDWQSGRLYFWADRSRIFWINVDDKSVVLSKTVATITTEGGGIRGWVENMFGPKAKSRPIPSVMVTAAKSVANSAEHRKDIPKNDPPKRGAYEFAPGDVGPVLHTIGSITCVGTIDQDGSFKPYPDDLYKTLEAMRKGVDRVGSWPPYLLDRYKTNDKLFEFRKGILIPMIMDKDRGLIPEIGGTIMEFKDYEYSPSARPIYNLPGRFVLKKVVKK